MFKLLEEVAPDALVSFTFEGGNLRAPAGATVAGALLGSGVIAIRRSPVSGVPRGPFCMMGTCFECLVQIDGVSVQACQVQITEGMVVRRVPVDAG